MDKALSEWSLNEDFNKESFKMLAWHRFVLWQQIIQSEPKRIRDSGGVQSVLMDIVEQQQKEWDELKNKLATRHYCPACGEQSYTPLPVILPGQYDWKCPKCGERFRIDIGFYEKEEGER